jgi:hypothetical protein
MLWYYSRIIDWMIANPGRPLSECAQYIGRTQSTLSIIINSDMFKAALAQRKAEFQQAHDFGIIEKTAKIAHASLDAILETLDKKRSAVPINELREISESALKTLGYGTTAQASPGVTLNFNEGSKGQVVLPVSPQHLEEARMALRLAQSSRPQTPPASHSTHDPEVVDVESREVEPLEPSDGGTRAA